MIAGVVLAAGRGSRFGSDKRLHEVAGRPLIAYALGAAVEARLAGTYVVVGPNDAPVRNAIASALPAASEVHYLENHRAQLGMMSSLQTALKQLPARYEAAMAIHADMPLVTTALVNQLIDTFEQSAGIVLPRCSGRWRHPRVIPSWLFDDFMALRGNERGAGILEGHPDRTTVVEVTDPDMFIDVDSPADIERVARRLA